MILTEEIRRTQRKACQSFTLPTTNPTWTALDESPGLRFEKPVTNHLSYGTPPPSRAKKIKVTGLYRKLFSCSNVSQLVARRYIYLLQQMGKLLFSELILNSLC
jgi:hypothetical protein